MALRMLLIVGLLPGLLSTAAVRAEDPIELAGLLKDLKSSEPVRKRKAAKAIGELGTSARSAAPALVAVLEKDRDTLARRNAAEALGQTGGDSKTVVAALAKAMKDSDQDVMVASAMALATFGKSAVPALSKALKDDDALVRKNAADALAKIGPDAREAVDELIQALKNEKPAGRRRDNSTKASYVEALAAIGPSAKSAVKYLEESIAERNVDREYRRVVTEALRKIKKTS
jgi:HEAT repeat protein